MPIRYLSGLSVDSTVLVVDAANDRVGIGTASPATALDVNGTISVSGSPVASFSGNYNRILRPNAIVGIYLGNATDAGSYYDNTTHYFRSSGGASTYAIIDYLGNVGIGTTAPGAPLSVAGAGGSTKGTNGYIVHIGGTDGNVDPVRYMIGFSHGNTYTAANVRAALGMMVTTGGAGNLVFETGLGGAGQLERMRINGDGNVGIGTASPTVKLQVDNNSHNYIQVNSSVANVQTAINVTNSSSTSRATLSWEDGTRGAYADLYSSTYLSITTQSSEKMRITSAGSVGIGTTAPATKLEVYGGHANTTARLYSTGDGASSNASLDMWASEPGVSYDGSGIGNNVNGHPYYGRRNALLAQSYIRFYNGGILLNTGSTTASQTVTVLANGNALIGTTTDSGYKLDVNGATQIQNELILSTNDAAFRLYRTTGVNYFDWSSGQDLRFSTVTTIGGAGRSTAVTFLSNGNVGIGTTAPITKLTVGSYSGSRLPYINGTANTFDANGITVTSSNTANAAIGGGIDLTNNVHSVGSFSPLISFSALSQSGTYNNNYAAIYGILAGAGGDANWNTGHIVFATAESYGASEKMRITSAGNVGIGTASPTNKLEVIGNIYTPNSIYLGSSGVYSKLGFYRYEGSAVGAMGWHTDDKFYIGGFPGWGPTAGNDVRVYGFGANLYLGSTTAGDVVTVTTSGNVGIGTTAPATKLHIHGYTTIDSVDVVAAFSSDNTAKRVNIGYSTSGDYGFINAVHTGVAWKNLIFGVNGGNVGIGTTAPVGILHLYKAAAATRLAIDGDAGQNRLISYRTGALQRFGLYVNNTAESGSNAGSNFAIRAYSDAGTLLSTPFFINRATGNVGIGTTAPNAKLEVQGADSSIFQAIFQSRVSTDNGYNGGIQLGNAAANQNSQIYHSSSGDNTLTFVSNYSAGTGNKFIFAPGGTERVRFQQNGNVGIGTTSPTGTYGKLTVAGGIHITNDNNAKLEIGRYSAGAPNSYIKLGASSNSLRFTNNTDLADLMELTNSGNLGLGVTPSAWDTTASKAIQLNGGSLWGFSTSQMNLLQNAFYNTSGDIAYINSASASAYRQISGVHSWYTAPSGTAGNAISFTQAMTLDASSNLYLGKTSQSGNAVLTVRSSAGGNTGIIMIEGDTANDGWGMYAVTADEYIITRFTNGSYSDKLTIASTGAATFSSSVTASSLIKSGGTASQYLMADGSVSTLTNPVTGTGTTNYIPKFTGASTIGDSLLVDNGTNVYLGNVDGGGKALVINGTGATTATIYFDSTTKTYGLYQTGTQSNLLTGNVGIGTTNPNAPLHIVKDLGTSVSAVLRLRGSNSTARTTRLQFEDYNGTIADGLIDFIVPTAGSSTGARLDIGVDSAVMSLVKGGNVGIGTTAPGNILSIRQSNTSSATTLELTNTSVGSNTTKSAQLLFMLTDTVGTVKDAASVKSVPENVNVLDAALTFSTRLSDGAPAEQMRITSGGNVGIGTTAPTHLLSLNRATQAAAYQLNINNAGGISNGNFTGIRFSQDSDAATELGNIKLHYYSTGATDLSFGTRYSATAVYIQSAGNVGIGTTAPNARLDLGGSYGANGEKFFIYNDNSSSALAGTKVGFYMDRFSLSNNVTFVFPTDTVGNPGSYIIASKDTSGTTLVARMTVLGQSGNVGIGTTAPSEILEASRSTNGDIAIKVTNSNTGSSAAAQFFASNGTNQTQFFHTGTSYTGSGVLTSAAGLGGLYNATVQGLAFLAANASGAIKFATGTGNDERMRITAAGNVGIGTTSPAYKLHVEDDDANSVQLRIKNNNITNGNKYISLLVGGTTGFSVSDWANSGVLESAAGLNSNLVIGNYENGPIIFQINNRSEKMRITAAGNVGIGTTGPVTPLQVVSATNAVDVLRIGNTAGDSGSVQGFTHLAINHFNAGTFPSTRITAYQDGVSGWPGGMYFSTREVNTDSAPLERLRITSAGSVGINTTNPTSRLEVVGDARITTGSLGVGVAPNATDGRIDASNDIVAFSTSDRRLKENITPIANALEKVRSLTGVEFDWKEETKSVHGYEGHDVGVIAQDVQAVLPEAVRTNDSGYLSVRYEKMIALLVEANKELADRVEQLEKLIK